MKTSHFLVPAIFTLAAGFAFANDEYKSFDEVDKNSDGLLSMQEARDGLPGLQISSSGGASASGTAGSASADGMLTRDQVKRAIPQINFEDSDRGPVTEEEYDMIVEHLQERGSNAAATTSSQSGQSGAAGSQSRQSGAAGSSTRSSSSGAGAADSSTNRNTNSTQQPGATGVTPRDSGPAASGQSDRNQ